MVRTAVRGWELMRAGALLLLLGGVVWNGLNLVTAGLLAGPALVGLFTVAWKAHQGRAAEPGDLFVAFEDPAPSLLAGLVFVLPFQLADSLGEGAGAVGLPPLVAVALAAWFALGVHVFARLADAPGAGLRQAVSEAWALTEQAAGTGRWSGLARHLSHGMLVFLLVALARALPHVGGLTLVVTLPLAACLLTAWHAHVRAPSESAAASRALPASPADAPAAPSGRSARKKTPSRRSSATRSTKPADDA